jgi:hypothetical protein
MKAEIRFISFIFDLISEISLLMLNSTLNDIDIINKILEIRYSIHDDILYKNEMNICNHVKPIKGTSLVFNKTVLPTIIGHLTCCHKYK